MTVAQVQALERTSDPFDELAYMLGGNRMNDRFWRDTLVNLGRRVGATEPVVGHGGRVHRQAPPVAATPRNVRNSATIRAMRHTLTAPVRWLTGRS